MSLARSWLAVIISLPVCCVAVRAIAIEVADLSDPCVEWGAAEDGSFRRGAGDGCAQRTGFAETRTLAEARTAAVPGMILLAAVLGVWGAARSRRKMTAIGALLVILEAIPLVFSLWPLPLLAGAGFLWLARRDLEPPYPTRPGSA